MGYLFHRVSKHPIVGGDWANIKGRPTVNTGVGYHYAAR